MPRDYRVYLDDIIEAAEHEEVRSRHPDIEWKKIAGLRDILVHEYFGIDVDIVWDVVANKLPDLKLQIEKILAD